MTYESEMWTTKALERLLSCLKNKGKSNGWCSVARPETNEWSEAEAKFATSSTLARQVYGLGQFI